MNRICVAAILLALLVSMACADTVTLKNGTKVEGTVIKFGTEYRVKQADGTTRTVLEKDVAAVTKGAAPIPAAMDSRFGAGGAAVQDQPIRQQQSPGSDTILYDGQRMSISEHREFIAALKGAITWTPRDPWSVMRESQFLKTLARYPRSLQANCALAFYHLRVLYERPMQRSEADAAMGPLNRALAINPESYDVWAMVAIAQRAKGRLSESLEASLKTFRLHPNEETAQGVFLDAIGIVEGGRRGSATSPALLKAAENARAEVSAFPNRQSLYRQEEKLFGVGGAEQLFPRVPENVPGQIEVGSGFMLTENGHVIVPKSLLREGADVWVFVKHWDVKRAQVLAIDFQQDLALLKIDADTAFPCAAPDSARTEGNLSFWGLSFDGEANSWGHHTVQFKDGVLKKNLSILKGAPAFKPGGVAAMWVGGTSEKPTLVSGAEILDFVNASKGILKGAKPGGSVTFGTVRQAARVCIAVFVLEKNSPDPWSPTSTTQPRWEESSPSPAP